MEWIKITLCATFFFYSFCFTSPLRDPQIEAVFMCIGEHLETCTSALASCTLVKMYL